MKVLILDDSPFVRGVVRSILRNRGIDVISAGSLREGLLKLSENPDLILLDINLPDGNGLEILNHFEPSRVIVFSGEKSFILRALEMGILDFIPKPKHPGEMVKIVELIEEVLISNKKKASKESKNIGSFKPEIVLVGASSGSPRSIMQIFSRDVKVPVVIALHIHENFAESFANRIRADVIYPGKTTIESRKYLLHPSMNYEFASRGVITSTDVDSFYKPSVDVLFSSAPKFYKDKVLGIILSGIGKDGREGCKEIKRFGGRVVAQSRESAPVWGMPAAVSDITDGYLNEKEISSYLNRLGVFDESKTF